MPTLKGMNELSDYFQDLGLSFFAAKTVSLLEAVLVTIFTEVPRTDVSRTEGLRDHPTVFV